MYDRNYYQKNKEKISKRRKELFNTPEGKLRRKNNTLKQRYGITLEECETLFESQEGKCAICERLLGDKFVVDHDHDTGEVRGLLCYACNNGIGQFSDNVLLLEKAIDYLK